MRADLSPGDAAVFAHAIEALAKPRPGTTSDGDVVPEDATTVDGKPARTHGVDQRSPGKRRADALGGGTARTQRSEAGEIGDTNVVWDLVPGRMLTRPLPPDDLRARVPTGPRTKRLILPRGRCAYHQVDEP
ncbi:hypothetical protein [Leekyejoonella antrihumi]|uniref:Uncharacterized protein n=1 Tax=Leekyejoonella antrihumi TaxID=1660198 RepID=A0A563DXB1_9MICO|nr:hypothetical protein [Leekyejoonella antrihumi]TWP34928.1 hypothetical protein FGL98_15380 [Leekyejoonella antrihumi]